MIEVKIEHEKPMSIMAIVGEMREYGYTQQKDFDFTYYPSEFKDGNLVPRYTIFTFYQDTLASWFALKYSR